MLYEIKNVKQYPNEPKRKWFFDHSMDLTVWFDEHENVLGFQLCYNKTDVPHALTWTRSMGYRHNRIDDGESGRVGKKKGIPILLQDGMFPHLEVAESFKSASGKIDPSLSSFVYQKLIRYQLV
jgi:hypothetical protein